MSQSDEHDDSFEGVMPGRRLSLLEGIKVVDLTHFLAGPYAGMIFGDLGASVLKVEQIQGDSSRSQPPYFFEGDSAYFLAINRNKDSIALDIASEEGRAILRRILEGADIVLDNLRSAQRERLGLSFEDLQEINPRIISCSITGFGSDGPYSDRPAYAIIVEALSGVMSLTGPEGGPSVRSGVPIGDISAGMYAVIGALAALESRRSTGRGQHIDVSMLDCQVSLLSYMAQYFLTGGLVAKHQGRAHLSIPTYNTFETKDGIEIVVAANTEDMWRSLCSVLHLEQLVDDPRFRSNRDRLEHRDELIPMLESEIKKWPIIDLYNALVEANVPAAPINSIDVALKDAQVNHRGMIVEVPHRSGKDFMTVSSPVKSESAIGATYTSPPGLGSQTTQVLLSLGYSESEIASLVSKGVVAVATD